jgi:hypothetical protein
MSTPLVYIDQNIVSFQSDGNIDLSRLEGVQWVYSKEHFAEIRRSKVPLKHLGALDQLGARLLDIDLINWKYSGSATLSESLSATEAYEQYLASTNEVPFDAKGLQVLMAWFNGGADSEAAMRVPDELEEQLRQLVAGLPPELIPENIQEASSQFRKAMAEMVSHGNNIERTRQALGVGKGAAGGITGHDPIRQIWQLVAPNAPGLTCDQFFGFEPIEAIGQGPWTAYEGIIRCCAMLDIVGFQAEKKARDPEKIENVMSDAAHIAAAAFCSAVISSDRRFARRAKAIYEYKGVGTASLIMSVAG